MPDPVTAYQASICHHSSLRPSVPYTRKAVDRIQQAFQAGRTFGLTPSTLNHTGQLFRAMYGNTSGLHDRLGPINDVLIAPTAREVGTTVLTNNLLEFRRIAGKLPGLNGAVP